MSKRTSILISGAAALAFLGMMGTPAEAFIITAGTTNPGPVQPLDLGTGAGGGFINATTINNPSADISSIVFTTAGDFTWFRLVLRERLERCCVAIS